jgi:F-type H+-transporting ATPase subunit b
MSIDWFVFAAQIVNFLVLVALLKRFLYGPIVKAMHEREERIESRLEEADRKRREAEEEEEKYREANASLDEERRQRLEEVRQEAEETRKQLWEEARRDVERKRKDWHESLERQRESLLELIRQRASQQVLAATQRALAELADAELEGRMVDVFLQRFEALEEDRREKLREAIQEDGQPLTIRSAFGLSEDRRQRLRETLQDAFQVSNEIEFTTSPAVVCGLELQAGGHKMGWSVDQFLASLEDELGDVLRS